MPDDLDPVHARGISFQDLLEFVHAGIRRAIIHKNTFDVRIGLVQYTHGTSFNVSLDIVNRNADGNERMGHLAIIILARQTVFDIDQFQGGPDDSPIALACGIKIVNGGERWKCKAVFVKIANPLELN